MIPGPEGVRGEIIMANEPKILVVDDDEDFRDMLREYLSEKGYEVLWAEDGAKAVQVADNEKPDIIFLDVMMPEKNGFEVCKLIKSGEDTKHCTIIMLTVKNGTNDKLSAYLSGAHRFISKPCQLSEIEACLRVVLQQRDNSLNRCAEDPCI